jgi:hypothetical protein
VTFETGGISIKPAEGMERMRDDMAGGAAVACAMRAIALLRAPIRVIGVVPATENMPGGRAIKPGDILTSASGKTVEVINTDAEGRLILGDGLWYAMQLGATHLVDVATLTGAVVVALGKSTSGLFGTPPEFVEQVRRVADRVGDRAWPMPLFDEAITALLPCYWIYWEMGQRLHRHLPTDPMYAAWIQAYANPNFGTHVEQQLRLIDRLAPQASERERQGMAEHFAQSCRYEFLFWDQAYHQTTWPV